MQDKTLRKMRIFVIAAASAAMFLLAFENYAVWEDEIFTLKTVDSTMQEMMNAVISDMVHPPLYYLLLKLFLSFSTFFHLPEIPSAKIFSAFWIVLVMWKGSGILSRRYGERTTLLFALFLCGTETVGYSVEIRMYSMALSTVCLAWLYGNEWDHTDSEKDWTSMCLYSIIGAYAHYFSIISLAILWLWILSECRKKNRTRQWIVSFLILLACYLPWITAILINLSSFADYASPATLKNLINLFLFPFSSHNTVLSTVVILSTGILLLLILKNHSYSTFSLLAILNPAIIGIVCVLLSFATRKFFSGRYLLPGWGTFWAGIAISLKNAKIRYRLVCCVLICLDLLQCIAIGTVEYDDKINAQKLIKLLNDEKDSISYDDNVASIITYYNPKPAVDITDSSVKDKLYITYTPVPDKDLYETLNFSVGSMYVYRLDES